MRNSTLCYIERNGQYLMLHRVKKEHDVNRDKWIGIGGGFWEDESPEDCIRREAMEETGLTLGRVRLRSVVTFVMAEQPCEHMFLFTCDDFSGDLADCDEGILEWIDKRTLYDLELWEGDRIFLQKLERDCQFFTLKLAYDKSGTLLSAILNGQKELKTPGVPIDTNSL